MSNNSNRRESIFASDRDPKDENPDQIPSIQYTSTLKELDQRPSDSFFPIATANTLAVGSPKGIFGSCLEISDMPSLNALQTESKGATTTASLNPSQNTIDDHTPLPPKGLKKPNLPLDPRRPLIKNKFQKMNSFKLARPPGINSPTASEAQGLIAGSSTPTGYSSLGRRMFEERRKEQGITERDSLEEEWDERKGPRPAGKRWRKVMVMMQALSKMKKNPKGPEVELSQKQLELLYDFGTHQEPKSSVPGKKRLSQQDSIRINHSNSGLPLLSGQESSRGTSVWDLVRRVGRLVLRRKERILPEGIAREAMRKEGKSKLEGFWMEMRKPFSPSDKFRLRWDMLLMFLVVIDMIILPLQISFSIFGAALEYQYTTDVIFIFDILLTFHTGYYLHGDLVTNHKDIAKSYAKSWLVVDFISAFPFHAIEEAQYTDQDPASSLRKPSFLKLFRILRIVKVLRALRFFKLSKIFWKFKVFFGYSQAHSFFQLLKLIIIVLLLTHWLACIWHMVAVFELEFTDNNTWLNSRGLLDADSAERYINSLYWAVTTILTVGYGDITPVSIPELWCAVFSMFFACGVFAYSLNTIGGIINDISESRAKVSWKIYAINKFMQKKNMAKGLQERVRGYMEHLLEEENTRKHDQEEFLAMMPEHLKKDILMDLNGRLLTENPIFSSNFTLKFLQELATKLQEKSFGPGENIYTENDKNQESSFFIVTKGKVQLYLQKTNQSLKTLMAEEYFGEVSFFSDNKRTISARSANYSHLFYLEKNGFLEILEHFPQEKEAYCEIRDKANLYNDFSSLRVRCLACNRENHCTQSCPQLQYIPDYQYIIQFVRNEDQRFRASFMRRERKNFNALNDKAQIHDATEKFRDDLLGLPMPRVYSRNSSLTFKPENKPKRSQTDLSFDSDHLLEEDKEDKFENECNKPELLSLIEEEDIIDDHSHVLVLSPKSMTLKFKELSQYAEIMKTEANKSYMKKKKKSEIVFEKIQIFSRYFVHNNIDNVISRINRLNQRKENVSKQDKNNRRGSTTDTLELSAVRGKSGKSRPLLLNSLSSLPGFLKKLKHGSETLD